MLWHVGMRHLSIGAFMSTSLVDMWLLWGAEGARQTVVALSHVPRCGGAVRAAESHVGYGMAA